MLEAAKGASASVGTGATTIAVATAASSAGLAGSVKATIAAVILSVVFSGGMLSYNGFEMSEYGDDSSWTQEERAAFDRVEIGNGTDLLEWLGDFGGESEENPLDSTTRTDPLASGSAPILGQLFMRLLPIDRDSVSPADLARGFEDGCSAFFQQYLPDTVENAACSIVYTPPMEHGLESREWESYDVLAKVTGVSMARISSNTLVSKVNDNVPDFITILQRAESDARMLQTAGTNASQGAFHHLQFVFACLPGNNAACLQMPSMPSSNSSDAPTVLHSDAPSTEPSQTPPIVPSSMPSGTPTVQHSDVPSMEPSHMPSPVPSTMPSNTPTVLHSSVPSIEPSQTPSTMPRSFPNDAPTVLLSNLSSFEPSQAPSTVRRSMPSGAPTVLYSNDPLMKPSHMPSAVPSNAPTVFHSDLPSIKPSRSPSGKPSTMPSNAPTVLHSDRAID